MIGAGQACRVASVYPDRRHALADLSRLDRSSTCLHLPGTDRAFSNAVRGVSGLGGMHQGHRYDSMYMVDSISINRWYHRVSLG